MEALLHSARVGDVVFFRPFNSRRRMPTRFRVPFALLIPSVALLALAFSRGSLEAPPPAETASLTWRQLHRHDGRPRGPNGLGANLSAIQGRGRVIYAMSPQQSIRSVDGGATWTDLPRKQNGVGIAVVNDSLVLIGGFGGRIYRSTDGGQTWKEIQTADDALIVGIALDGLLGVAVGRSILLTTDGGASWRRVKAPKVNYYGTAIRGRIIVVAGGAGLVVRSEDGGETWTEQWLPTQALLTAAAFASDSVVVIATSEGPLLRSTDAGRNWSAIERTARAWLRGIAFAPDGEGLAVGYWGEAIRSTDAGATWRRERSGTRLHFVDVEANPSGGFLVSGVRETVFSVTAGDAR